MIGHRTSFRENDDLHLWRGPAVKKKPPFFYACAPITREIMRSWEAHRLDFQPFCEPAFLGPHHVGGG